MIFNNHLAIPALKLGFDNGYCTNFASYQNYYDIKIQEPNLP